MRRAGMGLTTWSCRPRRPVCHGRPRRSAFKSSLSMAPSCTVCLLALSSSSYFGIFHSGITASRSTHWTATNNRLTSDCGHPASSSSMISLALGCPLPPPIRLPPTNRAWRLPTFGQSPSFCRTTHHGVLSSSIPGQPMLYCTMLASLPSQPVHPGNVSSRSRHRATGA